MVVTYKCRKCNKEVKVCFRCGPQRTYNEDTNEDFMGFGELRSHDCENNSLQNCLNKRRFSSLPVVGIAEVMEICYQ